MKTFETMIKEQKTFEMDTITIEDEEIIKYLGNDKVIIVSDEKSNLKKSFKSKTQITKDKILGTLNNIKTVFTNLKITKDNHFYYFNSKDKSKIEKILK
jgi:hypothetical protein